MSHYTLIKTDVLTRCKNCDHTQIMDIGYNKLPIDIIMQCSNCMAFKMQIVKEDKVNV